MIKTTSNDLSNIPATSTASGLFIGDMEEGTPQNKYTIPVGLSYLLAQPD